MTGFDYGMKYECPKCIHKFKDKSGCKYTDSTLGVDDCIYFVDSTLENKEKEARK